MKRWIFWSCASGFTFVIGCLIAFTISTFTSPISQVRPFPRVSEEPTTSSVEEFVFEFRDLPTFDDINYRKPSGQLIELIEDGIYRRSDVVAKNGEEWLVMSESEGHTALYPRIAQVKQLNSTSWPGEEKDARLSFNALWGSEIIALRNVKNVGQGDFKTLFLKKLHAEDKDGSPDYEEISTNYRREFLLNGNKYVLRTAEGSTEDGTAAAVIVLETEGKQQVVRQIRHLVGGRDIFGSLLWVGDMDRDGKLDLYLDEFNEKGFTATELYLSSHADTGKLVGLAADFGMPGC